MALSSLARRPFVLQLCACCLPPPFLPVPKILPFLPGFSLGFGSGPLRLVGVPFQVMGMVFSENRPFKVGQSVPPLFPVPSYIFPIFVIRMVSH